MKKYMIRLPVQVTIKTKEVTKRKWFKDKVTKKTFRYEAVLERDIELAERPNKDTYLSLPFITIVGRFKVAFNQNTEERRLAYYLEPQEVIMGYPEEFPLYSPAEFLAEKRKRFKASVRELGWKINRFDTEEMELYNRIINF